MGALTCPKANCEKMVTVMFETVEINIVRDIKEELCYVAQDWEAESEAAKTSAEHDKQYTLPNKAVITVPASCRMGCPELLFKPNRNGMSCKAIHELAWASVTASISMSVRSSAATSCPAALPCTRAPPTVSRRSSST